VKETRKIKIVVEQIIKFGITWKYMETFQPKNVLDTCFGPSSYGILHLKWRKLLKI